MLLKVLRSFKIAFLLIVVYCSLITTAQAQDEQYRLKNESEAGVMIVNGNADSQSVNAKQMNSYAWHTNLLKFDGRYLQSSASGIESARYWLLGLRYEREISPLWSIFVAQNVESDIFSGYDRRYNSDIGAKYYAIKKNDHTIWFFEAGYRYTTEREVSHRQHTDQFARLYTEVERHWSSSASSKFWLEYLPNLDDGRDYQVNSEISLSTVLTDIFSVKTAYMIRHDSQRPPPATVDTDTIFTTSLVAKF